MAYTTYGENNKNPSCSYLFSYRVRITTMNLLEFHQSKEDAGYVLAVSLGGVQASISFSAASISWLDLQQNLQVNNISPHFLLGVSARRLNSFPLRPCI